MKCPIFQIIRDFLMAQADFKSRCFLKETHTTDEIKQFYKILLPESRDVLMMNNQILERREHHVSIYEDQAWSEKHYKSTYHYTGVFSSGLNQITLHVYFDANGQFCYIHVKDEKNNRIDNLGEADQKNIRIYAEAASMHVISSIQNKAAEISQNFEKEFNQDVVKLEEISKQLSQESIAVLSKYIAQLEQCLTHFEKLEKYTYAPRKDMHKMFMDAHKYIRNKIAFLRQQTKDEQEKKKLMTIDEAKNSSSETLPKISIISNSIKTESQQQKMKAVNDELNSLIKIAEFGDRVIKEYELLNEKAVLCDNDDLDTLVFIMTRVNKLLTILQKQLVQSAIEGKLDSVKKLVKYVDYIPPNIYFVCVNNGFVDVGIFLITHYKFNVNIYNFICGPNAPVALMGETLLLIAIQKEQFNMFKWLLENGANPNLVNPIIGLTPLMIAVFKKLYQYAELLFLFKPNPNVGCYPQDNLLMTDSVQLAQAVVRQSVHNNTGDTALHYACKYNLLDFIKLLFANGVDPARLNIEKIPPYFNLLIREDIPINQEAMQYFLAKKVDIDFLHPKTQINGLYFACQKGMLEDVRFLVMHGADPNMPTNLLTNCIHSQDENSNNMLRKIIDQTLHGEHRSKITPLIKAVLKGFDDIVKYLLTQTHVPVTIDNVYNSIQLAKLLGVTKCIHLLNERYQLLDNPKTMFKPN